MMKRPQILPPLRETDEGQLVSLTIDGQEVKSHTSTTILEAANSAGIKIPHLCILKELEPYGGCRVCVVEVAGEDRPVASCATFCAEGISYLKAEVSDGMPGYTDVHAVAWVHPMAPSTSAP